MLARRPRGGFALRSGRSSGGRAVEEMAARHKVEGYRSGAIDVGSAGVPAGMSRFCFRFSEQKCGSHRAPARAFQKNDQLKTNNIVYGWDS